MARPVHIRPVNFGDNNTESGNISHSFNKTYIVGPADEKSELLQCLSPLEPQNRHQDVRADRFDGVGDWLLQTNEFWKWKSSEGGADRAVLFCSGEPGVGKTYLSSLVIDSLYKHASKEDIAVLILYCDYREQQFQTAANMIGSILKQLVAKDGTILGSLQKAKNDCGGRGLRLPDLAGILKESIASFRQVFICIDALDEFVSKELPKLLVSLKDIVQGLPNVHVFLTGRPHVEAQITRHFTKVVTVPISPNPQDIESYLRRKLEMDTEPHVMDDGLRRDIIRTINDSLSESFLLVSLSIDAILEEVTVSDRRNKLNQMSKGDGLGDVYTKTLERIKAQKGPRPEFGIKALMWVAHSERPLQASELCYALGVKIGSADSDIELGDVPKIETLLGRSLGLITLEKSSATVRLVHFTLRDHLSNTLTLFESPHSMIAEICLTYLHFRSVWKLPSSPRPVVSTFPLLDYASCYWERHARREMTEDVEKLVLSLLNGFGQHISSSILLSHRYYYTIRRMLSLDLQQDWYRGFTCLHWTAALGMSKMTSTLLEMKEWDLNVTDTTGNTAIAWAARMGHKDILKKLLEQNDTDPNIADNDGRTSLSWAAWQGDKELVNILLEWEDINLDPVHRDGRTPLLWAVSMGHEEVVKLILKRKDAAFGLAPNSGIPVAPPTKLNAPTSNTPLIIQILIDCLVISISLCLLIFLSWIIPASSKILLSFR